MELPIRDINGTKEERDMVNSLNSKKGALLGVLEKKDLPLTDKILKDLNDGEWIWKLEPETEGYYVGLYGGIWIKNDLGLDVHPLVFVDETVYREVILKV